MSPFSFSFLASLLPPLPILPFPSLPQNLQRRLLSFLLRKSVGRFVRGGLDAEAIEADLGKGSVRVQGLELESDAITPLLEGLPLSFASGTIGLVAAQVTWPLSLSSALSIEVEDISLVLLVASPLASSTSTLSASVAPSLPPEEGHDMADSIISVAVASEFVKEELTTLEDAELRQSLHLGASGIALPGAFAFGSGAREKMDKSDEVAEVTMLAGLIERILARLSVRVRRVRVRIVLEDDGDERTEVELRVEKIVYADEKGEDMVGSTRIDPTKMASVRSLRIFKPEVLMRMSEETRPMDSSSVDSLASEASTASTSSEDEVTQEQDMMMSQSIADLRTSFASSASGGVSMYASARGGTSIAGGLSAVTESAASCVELAEREEDSPFLDPEAPAAAEDDGIRNTSTTSDEAGFQTILSFGPEPIVLVLSTSKTTTDPASSDDLAPPIRRRPEVNLHSSIAGPITLLLLPQQIQSLLFVSQLLPSSPPRPPPPPSLTGPPAADFTAAISIKAIYVLVIYEDAPLSSSALDAFWSHPVTSTLPLNHLRLRLDGLGAALVRTPHESQTVFPLRSFLLTESVRLVSEGETRALPIALSDPNLAKQYEETKTGFPGFESVNWIENGAAEGRGWKVKAKSKRASGSGKPEQTTVPAAVTLSLADGRTSLQVEPVHIFLELTLIERLQPLVTSLADILSIVPLTATQTLSTPRPRTPRTPAPLSLHRVLEDLSFEPLERDERPAFELQVALVRIEVRCPPPARSRKRAKEWTSTRSGIALLDMHEIKVAAAPEGGPGEGVKVEWERSYFFFLATQGTHALAFLSLSALPADPADSSSPPTILVRRTPSADLSASRDSLHSLNPLTTIDCRLPLIRSSLDKATLDGLQLFADDLTQWSERAFRGPEGMGEGHRLVGSRYFGARSFSRGRRAESESEESVGEGASAMTIKVAVVDVIVDLFVAKAAVGQEKPAIRHLRGLVSDIDVQVELLRNSKNDLRAEVVVMDVMFEDRTSVVTPISILARTLPRNLTTGSTPLLKLSFTSAVEKETRLKESKVQLGVANFTYFLTADLEWLRDVSLFAKAPAGAFETVVPNELTRIRLRIADGSIHVSAPNPKSHLVLSVGDARIATNLMPDMPRTLATVELTRLRVFAVDGVDDLLQETTSAASGEEHWKSKGFVQLVDLERTSLQIRQGNGLVLPDLELAMSNTKLTLAVCADTIGAVGALVADLTAGMAAKSDPLPRETQPASRRVPTHKPSEDLLSSVDPSAFRHAASLDDMPEYLNDDVPTNFDYLADALDQGTGPTRATRRSSSSQAPEGLGHVISDIEGETIRMLDPRGLQILDDFLAVPGIDHNDDPSSQPASLVRCRLSNCDVTVHIHDGYDWFSTRKAIEEEAKAVRRRLEKIRQLLASGQAPDASADEASVLMFGSVQLGLPPGASELPTGQLLAAINEELDDHSDAVSDTSSWQPLSGQQASRKPTLVGKGRKRLTRSRAFAIEVNLVGINASFDSYPSTNQLASRLRAEVSTFEIIDNIRTSTWRKFLTELRASDGGVVRDSGSSMVRFEQSKVRPVGRAASAQEEIVMKIKILPLRLYIDQDALDFLKAFGAFRVPATGSTAETEPASGGPFFQRVEILPVKIKLDYKPKRVDYHALRRGKTAELMNFFHFDGSEMTLRHLVVTGVSGTTRLSDLVQDIWTPDVTANQLADVLSGISPVRSVVNVGSGVANLVLLPMEQYRKDGRLARGLQKGATAFARSTTLEALKVGARLATGTQVILEQAEAVLGARFGSERRTETLTVDGTPLSLTEEEQIDLISRYAQQPGDLREGIEGAYRSLGDNFRSAAQTILAVPMEVYERSGTEGPVRAVVRAVPIAVLKPMIGASEAVSKALLGLRNSLDPDAQAEAFDKYKRSPPSS